MAAQRRPICTFAVNKVDSTAPVPDVASLPPISGQCSVTITNPPTATDNCAGTVTGTTTNRLTYSVPGTYTVMWTYADSSSNTTTQTQSVVVEAAAPISITCPGTQTLALGGNCSATVPDYRGLASVSGGCSPVPSVTQSPAAGSTVNGTGTFSVTLTAQDGSPTPPHCTFTVNKVDNTAPIPDVASLPPINGQCSVIITNAPTATDNCAGVVTGTTTNLLTYSVPGTYTVMWTYADSSSNTTTQTQSVVVEAAAPISITCPSTQTLALGGNCSATVPDYRGLATLSGGCGPALTVTQSPQQGSRVTGTGSFTVTLTVQDGSPTPPHCTFTVNKVDSTAPVPDVASLPPISGQCSVTITNAPTATDNCAGVVNGTTSNPLTYSTQGSFTVTWTYDDGNGNTRTQTQTVIVDDTIAPVPTVASLPNVTGECSATVSTVPTANDNCAGMVNGTTSDPLTYNTQGTFVVVWTYNDGNGNTRTQTQAVVVHDTIAPSITTCATNQSAIADASNQALVPDFTGLTAHADDCSTVTVTQNPAAGTLVGLGVNPVVIIFTDATGNFSTCSATFTVNPLVPVNHAPSGADTTVVGTEDTTYTFTTANFGFSDPDDTPNAFLAVKITTLPATGSLRYKSSAVSAGQFVSVADINLGRLKFIPAANASGSPYTSFTFQVQDNGGTSGGGVDLDPTPNTMTIQIMPVNDAPTWTVLPPSASLTINEGQLLSFTVQANPNDAGQTITYSLLATPPPGASIDATTGVFTWTPNSTQGTANYSIIFRATDTGTPTPNLSVDTTKVIRVRDVRR